jgi:O-antigen/teichoic acid export membrane protein
MKWPTQWASSRLARGTLLLQVGGGGQRLVAMAAHFLLARFLGPDVYGEYVLVVSLATLLPFVFDLGVRRTVLTRFAAVEEDPQAQARILAFGLRALLVSAVATLALGFVLMPTLAARVFQDRELGLLGWALCWGQLAAIPYVLWNVVLEGARRMRAVLLLESSTEVLRLVAVASILLLRGGLRELVVGLVLVEVVKGLLASLLVARTWHRKDPLLPSLAVLRAALQRTRWIGDDLRFGLAASVSKRVAQAVQVLFPLLVGGLAAPRDAGFFRIGWTLGTLPLWLLTGLSRNLLPALSERYARGDLEGLRRVLRVATGAAGGLAVASGLVIAAVGPWLIDRVYGAGYGAALPVLLVFLGYTALVGCGLGHEIMYLVRSDLRFFAWRSVAFGVVLMGVAPWAIAAFGAVGAAWLMLAGTLGAFFVDFWRTWRFTGSPARR